MLAVLGLRRTYLRLVGAGIEGLFVAFNQGLRTSEGLSGTEVTFIEHPLQSTAQ